MSKVVESLLKDATERVKSPEFQTNVVEPLLSYILDMLFPYIAGVVTLLVLIFIGVVGNLGFLVYIVS
jgi:hypothetical protein